MKAKGRYCAVTVALALTYAVFVWAWFKSTAEDVGRSNRVDPALVEWINNLPNFDDELRNGERKRVGHEHDSHSSSCLMESCFDFSRCPDPPFLHHVYPAPDAAPLPSRSYSKILSLLRDSPLHTDDPSRACLFFVAVDTLDRDRKGENYVEGLRTRIPELDHWNNGTNHVIFNLFSGTYPDYREDELNFDPGKAILAKASFSGQKYRPGFDISLPLFHANHPARDGTSGSLRSNDFPVRNDVMVGFKGKRYVYGIGSKTRTRLHHLHNGKDVVLVTTCRHNKDWQNFKDDRCDEDNAEYDRWDFDGLLHNATFCLVPRGRRLGSFRMIEVLQAGCIPVVLANDWVLPFFELIDWTQAAVLVDERLLSQVPDIVRSIPPMQVFSMRQKTQILWDSYFNSVDIILQRTLEILHSRIVSRPHSANTISTDLSLLADSKVSGLHRYPIADRFTAIIYPGEKTCGVARVKAIMKAIAATKVVDKIIVIRPSEEPVTWSDAVKEVPVHVIVAPGRNATTASSRLLRYISDSDVAINTEGVFTISSADCGVGASPLSSEEIMFAFGVWRDHFSDRIVGYVARTHYWSAATRSWQFSSKLANDYSMVMLDAAFYHANYHALALERTSVRALSIADQIPGCTDVLMNMVVASNNNFKSPVALGQRRNAHSSRSSDYNSHWNLRQCFRELTGHLGHTPLRKSEVRYNPVLFKDAVSIHRKKYRRLESSGQSQNGSRRRHPPQVNNR